MFVFAVFHRGEFIDFWLNKFSNAQWVELTMRSKGWVPEDVSIIQFPRPQDGTVFNFNDEMKMEIYNKVEGGMELSTIVEGQVFFAAGAYNQDFKPA